MQSLIAAAMSFFFGKLQDHFSVTPILNGCHAYLLIKEIVEIVNVMNAYLVCNFNSGKIRGFQKKFGIVDALMD